MLDVALRAVVTILAERLKRAQPEQIPIAVVPRDVIDLRGDDGKTSGFARATPGLDAQLMRSSLAPATIAIPIIPARVTTVA